MSAVMARPFGFYLDGGPGRFAGARYSFLGVEPFLVFSSRGRQCSLQENGHQEERTADPFYCIKDIMKRYRVEALPGGPPFAGGAAGYFGYDMGRVIERIPVLAADDMDMPDCMLGMYATVVCIDHQERSVCAVATGLPEADPAAQKRKARKDIDRVRSLLDAGSAGAVKPEAHSADHAGEFTSTFSRDAYCEAVLKIKEHIAAGDVYQVNLSQRFAGHLDVPPQVLYGALRQVSPAPYSCFFNYDTFHILSSSPERFLRVSGSSVQTRPIKGTRPRGKDPEEDRLMREELMVSEKDHAELLMIIDLERNDLGRVCRCGSIYPDPLFDIEAYANVYHLVSTIYGEIDQGLGTLDCLRACFPGGSITGAPKIRAMEIIEELEPCRRSVYTGSLGYLGFNGEADLNIAIRTVLHRAGQYLFNVGGGIVADSDPRLEYEETLHKGRGIMQAIREKSNETTHFI